MLDTLVKDALAKVWCTPFQDAQALMKLTRATAYGGARDYVNIMRQRIALPEPNNRYHIYQIGQNDPARFRLSVLPGVWFKFSEVNEKLNKIVELYTTDGEQICRNEAYVMMTRSKAFVIAVRLHPGTADLNVDTLYVRLYSNAFYDTERADGISTKIKTAGMIVETVHQAVQLQNGFHQHRQLSTGYAYAFRNGRYVDDFPPSDVKPGDSVEWVYDASINRVVDLRLDDLPTFTSELDGVRKYLLHPPKFHNQIDYRDDLDFWIIHKYGNQRVDGLYYHKNSELAVRMVTHNDYSIPVGYVQQYLDNNPQWNQQNVYVRIHFRQSGYARPLTHETNSIHELYKLSDEDILKAMVGNGALVPAWRVNTLEQSNYTRLMRSLVGDITGQEVYSAYGYYATSKLIGDSPLSVVEGEVVLGAGQVANSTIFEYDSQGTLLSIVPHYSGDTHTPLNPNVASIEAVIGIGKEWFPEALIQTPTFELDPLQSQRFYASRIVGGVPTNEWQDVTRDESFVTIANGLATFHYDPDGFVVRVRGTEWPLVQVLDLNLNDGVVDFTIANREPDNHSIAWIPCGKLELWLNGKALIENIDYYVQWPQVVVVNKQWLLPESPTQRVVVRGTGLCNADMSRHVTQQIGFVTNQTLSINNRFNVRDAKVARCVVAGRTLSRDNVSFAEGGLGVATPAIADGAPYAIDEQLIPVAGVVPYDVYYLRQQGAQSDEAITDYLSQKIPEPQYPVVTIPQRYRLISPVIARVLFDLLAGHIEAPALTVDNNAIIDLFVPYRDLLSFDPAVRGADENFVVVLPHYFGTVVEVTAEQFGLLSRINQLYLNNRVDMTDAFVIVVNTPDEISDQYWDNVVYQLRFEGPAGSTNVVDDKARVWVSQNSAKLVGSGLEQFGTMLELNSPPEVTNGVGSARVYTNDVAGASLSADFTLEFWLKTNEDGVNNAEVVIDTSSPQGSGDFIYPTGWFQFMLGWNNTLEIYVGIDGQYYQTMISAENCLVLDQLNHVAWVREDGVSKLFVNGINVTSTYASEFPYLNGGIVDPHNYSTIQQWILGSWSPGYGGWPTRNVWLDNLRLTNGVARYSDTFDPNEIEFHVPD